MDQPSKRGTTTAVITVIRSAVAREEGLDEGVGTSGEAVDLCEGVVISGQDINSSGVHCGA